MLPAGSAPIVQSQITDLTNNGYSLTFHIPKGDKGDQGLPGTNGKEIEISANDSSIRYRYAGDSTWKDLVSLDSLKGSPGVKGDQGPKGDQGLSAYEVAKSVGYQGSASDWLNSLKGSNGSNGSTITSVSRDNTLSTDDLNVYTINVLHDGTPLSYNFSVRNGDQGKSAYDIAVQNGFKGSQTDWLESLKGKAGPQGPQGTGVSLKGTAYEGTLSPTESNIGSSGTIKTSLGYDITASQEAEAYVVNGFICIALEVGGSTFVNSGKIKGEQGPKGDQGERGIGLTYTWDGTRLGIKSTEETTYTYSDLKGEQGETGYPSFIKTVTVQTVSSSAEVGGTLSAPSLNPSTKQYEYTLTLKVLKGDKGDNGNPGKDGVKWVANEGSPVNGSTVNNSLYITGDYYLNTSTGEVYQYDGSIWNKSFSLKGPQGDNGDQGERGASFEYNWDGVRLGVRTSDETTYTYVNLQGPQGEKGEAGASIKVKPSESECIALNDCYIDTNGHLQILTALEPKQYTDAGNISGPEGPKGDTGPQGVGITNIEKTSAAGYVDNYTIYLSDGTTKAFSVTNGAPGKEGDTGIGIKDISLVGNLNSTSGAANTYKIILSNDEEYTFTVYNGQSGGVGPQGPEGPQGPSGNDGTDGTNGTQIYSGASAPVSSTGVDGDYYINTTNGYLYKKSSGTWVYTNLNLKGTKGDSGDDGADGVSFLEGYTGQVNATPASGKITFVW